MRKGIRGLLTVMAALVLTALAGSGTAWAMEAGAYLVTVTPSYTDPETGRIEDPGNNEAIGQGMTQKLCGPQGLLEVDAAGNMYLTVRYFMSQFVSDVSFEERNGGSYQSRSWERVQERAAVSGASNIDEKYGSTDYRIPIGSTDSVFRGKAYIEPMGRSVVYFFTISGPTAGSGDFVTSAVSVAAAEPEVRESAVREPEAGESYYEEDRTEDRTEQRADEEHGAGAGRQEEAGESSGEGSSRTEALDFSREENGSGNADDPVTGIPQRPSDLGSGNARQTGASGGASGAADGDYSLETRYELSEVPLGEARRLTEPLLEAATGLTGAAGDRADQLAAEQEPGGGESGGKMSANQRIMAALLGVSAVLLIRFAWGAVRGGRSGRRAEEREEGDKGDEAQ
ncbi:MAG: heme-binding Shp domain-containing protein [Eubacteriales bacterium]|nr:heme-binding Shp domain-containing protein [Eubacteriales bacterium]